MDEQLGVPMRNDGEKLYLTKHEYEQLMQKGIGSGIVHNGEEIVVTDDPADHDRRRPHDENYSESTDS